MKARAPGARYVDGAWRPRSDDLTMEPPKMIAVFGARERHESCDIQPCEWKTTPTNVTGERAVKLDGSRDQPANTVEVVDAQGIKVVLLVVPAHIDPDQAHSIVMAAAASGNASSVDALFMISLKDKESHTERAAAGERCDSQGSANDRSAKIQSAPRGCLLVKSSGAKGLVGTGMVC